jgi:diguanylate cyclase (GGDEF)-like protein
MLIYIAYGELGGMISLIQSWIVTKLTVGAFGSRGDVLRFSIANTLLTTIAAVILNAAVYALISSLPLLDIKAPASFVGDAIITAFVAGPISFLAYYLVGRAIFELAVSRNQFEHLSRTDSLTGLMNRRAFVDMVETLEGKFAIALFDVDRFKHINDTHGHAAGDHVLVEISRLMTAAFGQENSAARLGGEEFGVVLRNADRQEALASTNRFREDLAALRLSFEEHDIAFTISAGVTQGDRTSTYSSMLSMVDKALYIAKASGRNCVVHTDDIPSSIMWLEKENIVRRFAG